MPKGLSFRQPVEQIHRLKRLTWLADTAEPAIVDGHNPARAIKLRQSPVHRQTERRVIAAHHESVGLVGEQKVRQEEFSGVLRRYREPYQDPAIRSEGIGSTRFESRNPVRMIFDLDRFSGERLFFHEIS